MKRLFRALIAECERCRGAGKAASGERLLPTAQRSAEGAKRTCLLPIADCRGLGQKRKGSKWSPRNGTRIRDKIKSNLQQKPRRGGFAVNPASVLLSPSAWEGDLTISQRTKRVRISDFRESPAPPATGSEDCRGNSRRQGWVTTPDDARRRPMLPRPKRGGWREDKPGGMATRQFASPRAGKGKGAPTPIIVRR